MSIRAARVLVVSLSLSLATAALAQTAPPQAPKTSLSSSLQGEALTAYNAARLLFEDGDAAGALAKFRRAYELSRDARLLWNMAVCEKAMRHYASSARLVTQYITEAGPSLTPEDRRDAEATQAALRGFYSELTLEGLRPGARVSIDGAQVATAPLSGPLPIDVGQRQLLVELEGFEPVSEQLDVPGAVPMTSNVVMVRRKNSATLAVNAGPKDIISVDGKVMGSSVWRGPLAAGTHLVRVTASGKKPYSSELRLAPGVVRALEVTLQDEGHSTPIWPWIAGGAALVLGASVGGYFLLKPADNDPGPNGGLGRVYLPLSAR